MSLAALPIYIVLRDWRWAGSIAAVTAATSVFLKFNWYDKLEKAAPRVAPAPASALAPAEES